MMFVLIAYKIIEAKLKSKIDDRTHLMRISSAVVITKVHLAPPPCKAGQEKAQLQLVQSAPEFCYANWPQHDLHTCAAAEKTNIG